MSNEKECFKCGKVKLLSAFYKHKQMKDGHVNKCKDCNLIDVANHRAKNIDKVRAYDRGRGNRQDASYLKEYKKNNPKKCKAQNMVNNQKRAGNISELPCEVCGGLKVVAHHDDYDKPLNVRWLCQAHHKQWHAKNGEGLNGS
tara:strand:- start:5 stop:433 length:429 start_codon:yes stop_codon:yes gene_type:complete